MNSSSLKFSLLRPVLTLCLIFFVMTLTLANDGVYYTSGNQLLPLFEADIRVQREILTLRWSDDNVAEVDVYYEFYNPGKPKTVLMGFEADPPMYIDSISRNSAHPNIADFTVVMNGKSIPVSTTVVETDTLYVVNGEVLPVDLSIYSVSEEHYGSHLFTADGNDAVPISYVYHFNADFKTGINFVRHHYRYDMNMNICTHYMLDYKLSPALRWANHQIDDFTLRIETEDVPLHFMMEDSLFDKSVIPVINGAGKLRIRNVADALIEGEKSVQEVFLRNASIEWKATNFRPYSELHIFAADCTETGVIHDPSEYYSGRYNLVESSIHYDDIHRIVRNMPYAYRGYIFKNKYLNEFFTSRWWYIPDPDYKVDLEKLTPNERDWLKAYNEKFGK